MKFPFFKKKWGEKKEVEKEELIKKEDKTVDLNKGEEVIITPLITEKNLNLSKENIYTFKASSHLNRNQLKKIISQMFNVKVLKIRTINYSKRIRGRSKLKSVRPKFKKVLAKLAPGQKISLFE